MPLLADPLWYYPPICAWISQMVLFPQVSLPKSGMQLSLPHTKQSTRYPDTKLNIPNDTNLQHTQSQQLICNNCSSRNSLAAFSLQLQPHTTCHAEEMDALGPCTTFWVQHNVKMVMITDVSSSVHRRYSLKPYTEHDVGQNLGSWYDQRCCFLSVTTVLALVTSQAC
jgi:hypothetical protein